ncbi:MAG TPA: hypothetical protein VGL10_09245, partial [Gammaproteobacteria bacterium]
MGTKTIYSASYLIDQNRIWLTMNSLPSFNRPSSAINTLAATSDRPVPVCYFPLLAWSIRS